MYRLMFAVRLTHCWHFWRRDRLYYKMTATGVRCGSFCHACDTKYIEPLIPEDYEWLVISRSTSKYF